MNFSSRLQRPAFPTRTAPRPLTVATPSRPARRIALAATASLALTALAFVSGTKSARAQTTQTFAIGYYTASVGTGFTVPAGVTSIQIEAWGGGGEGAYGNSSPFSGGAGGGGASRAASSA